MVVWARTWLGKVVDINHREQAGVQGLEHKMCLVPAAIFYLQVRYKIFLVHNMNITGMTSTNGYKDSYPTGVLYDIWLELPSHLKNFPTPGLESYRPQGSWLIFSRPPHRDVQAVNNDVLRCLWAQQVQEVQLDTADSHCWLLKQKKTGTCV